MKKILLSTVAVAAMAVAAPAMAQDSGVKLGVSGYFKGYVTVANQDTVAGTSERSVDIIRDTEVHLSGETTLDNGLTVGAHMEVFADAADNFNTDESYVYFSGDWGRVNFGAEDAAAYLLQVAAPSADEDVDGLRVYINPVNYGLTDSAGIGGELSTSGVNNAAARFDYDQNISGKTDKVTYLTPVVSGFQGGISYTPDVGDSGNDLEGVSAKDDGATTPDQGDAWDVAIRYEGQIDQVGVTAGAGYSIVNVENQAATVGSDDSDDREAWNIGVDLDFGPFGLGAAYLNDNQGISGSYDKDTYVIGADYTTGPFKLGASYYNQSVERGAGNADLDTDRYTGGVVYTYGPGMTFNGSISYIDHEMGTATDVSATSVLLGTKIKF